MADLRGLRVDSFQCRNHPEREGVGICVACRRVFCVECSTKIDGVNHCKECLAKRARTAVATSSRKSGAVGRVLESLVALVTVAGSITLVAVAFLVIGESSAQGGARRQVNSERMASVARALRTFRRDTGAFPTEQEGLAALVRRPVDVTGWHGPYLDATFTPDRAVVVADAYGVPVTYRAPKATDPSCLVASGGANRWLETDTENARRLASATGGEAEAEGDDLVLFVD